MKKVVFISPHPDDETLGCGGTLLSHQSKGDEIHWLIATDIKEADGFSAESVSAREAEIKHVSDLYGFDSVHRLGFSTMKVDHYSMGDLVSKISSVINEIQPNIIYLPFKSDVHSDHRIIFNAAYSCTKTFRYPFIQKIYMKD